MSFSLDIFQGDRSNISLPRVLCLDHGEQFDHLHSGIFAHSQKTSLQPALTAGSWDEIYFLGNQFWSLCHILSFRFRLGCVALLRRGWTSVWAQPIFSLRWRSYETCLSPVFSYLSLSMRWVKCCKSEMLKNIYFVAVDFWVCSLQGKLLPHGGIINSYEDCRCWKCLKMFPCSLKSLDHCCSCLSRALCFYEDGVDHCWCWLLQKDGPVLTNTNALL